ncbi:MAG TPA: BACON domain-containing protein, partial [Ignavibacteriales bacterium]|nr:BACON domain-containing protein [Ignavibacteriales bacterium]
SVDISSNVAWSASESSDWFSITNNSGSITINYTENMTVFARTGSITVTGADVTKTINVSQVAGPERLDVNPLTKEVPYQEGGASFTVTANKAWTVSENLNWVVIPPESIENNKFVASINSNPSADSRTGNIVVKSGSLTKTISLTQLGAPPEIDAEPENSEVPYTAGTGFFTVTSNFSNWAAADEADWLTVTKSGSQVNFSYQENKTVSARIGKVIVSGRSVSDTVLVTQQAGLSDLNVTPINRDAAYTAGETSFDVTANVEWTVTEDAGWLTAAKSGTQILVTFEENPSTNSRTGKLTLSGGSITHELTVTQEGRPEEIMLTPASIEVAYTTGATSFSVAVNTASWSVSEGEYWLEVATSGSKTNITYEANTSVNIRTGKITVKAGDSSKVFTITQRGTPTAISSNPAGANVSFLEGAASFTITSNVEWTVSDNGDWLTSVKNGNIVQVNYAKNNLREQRQGIITVSGGGYSLDIILTQGGNLEVSKPLLIAPANNIYKSGLNLLFEWHKPALADEYSLEISDSVQFTNIIYSYKDITDSVYTIASLKEGVKYFWRIKAANSYGYSTY